MWGLGCPPPEVKLFSVLFGGETPERGWEKKNQGGNPRAVFFGNPGNFKFAPPPTFNLTPGPGRPTHPEPFPQKRTKLGKFPGWAEEFKVNPFPGVWGVNNQP